jgi:CD20-like family
MPSFIAGLCIAEVVLSALVIALGIPITIIEVKQLGKTFGAGLWLGILLLACGCVGIFSHKRPERESLRIAHIVASIVGTLVAIALFICASILYNAKRPTFTVSKCIKSTTYDRGCHLE